MSRARFHTLALVALVTTLGVIVWGAFVRASGSGAGCGNHWPMCNGEVIPHAKSVATLIEFTHRATTGVAAIAVALEVVWALRAFEKPAESNYPWFSKASPNWRSSAVVMPRSAPTVCHVSTML